MVQDEELPATPAKHDGFSVRKEPAKFTDALEDFRRYKDKKAWELAFRSLETLGEAKRDGMVPAGKRGFFVPSRQRILMSLTSLPPEGKQAFRLFYDAKAKQLLERAESAAKGQPIIDGKPVDEISNLREVVEKYFISSVGDKAADRLGDALFESGDFASAATTWNAILKNIPDTTLSRLRLRTKRATALARSEQWALFDQAIREISSEFAGEQINIAGKQQVATEYLEAIGTLRNKPATTRATTAPAPEMPAPTGPFTLPRDGKPAWQIKLLDESLARKLQSAITANGWAANMSGLRTTIPWTATDGRRVYCNWLGIVFAADVSTGKLVWRSRAFSQLGDKFQNFLNMMLDTDCYTLTRAGQYVLVTGVNLDRLNNYQEPVRLVCMNCSDGKLKWYSTSGPLASWNFVGTPATSGDVVYVIARQGQSTDESLLAVSLEKGELLWQVPLGTAQGGTNYRGENDIPRPLILPAPGGGTVYVVTNNGALAAVDTSTRGLAWAYTYDPPPVQNRQNFWGGEQIQARPKMDAAAFLDGSTLYFKEEGGSAVHALDVTGPTLLWKRPLDSDASIAPLGPGKMLVVGQDVAAIDARADRRPMKWSALLPTLVARVSPVVNENRVLVFAPRGVYVLDGISGDTVRIFRGADRDSLGGSILRARGRLICASNLAVTAYQVEER
jgi:outer membrane protein assembly factor BamB